jgi:protein-L-isoaspartate(D-aspartate) O-methyltransferase
MQSETDWHQYMIEFDGRAAAEHTAAHHLAPALNQARDAGLRNTWWYIRKTPGWRLRCRPADPGATAVAESLAELAADGCIAAWARGVYEPETVAFGGPAAMDVAHALFHHDSRHHLARAARHDPASALGRREAAVLLFGAMLRAAGLDWSEQGDTWAKIVDLRPAGRGHDLAPGQLERLAGAMRRLMTAAPRTVPGLLPEPRVAAFEAAGEALAALARSGRLERGLRAVLAHHFIFHANRVGLPGADQATMATLAVNTVFHAPERPHSPARRTPPRQEGPAT